jgi:hypothetical protein
MRHLFFLFFISSLCQGQAIRLGQFDEIKVFDGLRVTIIQSSSDSLVVEGKNTSFFSYKNKNGRLYLRMNLRKRLGGFDTTVALFTSNLIKVIDANQGSFVSFQDVLFQPSIKLKSQEGAEIDAVLDVQKVTTKTTSGGKVSLRGAAKIQDHKLNTGGIVEAPNLISSQADVRVKAGGRADIRASDLATAIVSLGGSVRVHGSPKQLVKRVDIGGTIELVNESPVEITNE